ncbi:MAG TPA: CHAT domain-containing protein [Verrucomicrobiae bacterium]|nr:CHAT domain-containing protein [Verrucomicrobiae bacterium]
MKSAKILICCLLVVPLIGTVPRSVPKSRAPILETPEGKAARRAPILALLRSATEVYRTGRYREALRGFAAMRTAAQKSGVPDLAARALGNIGGCQFALHQYNAALETFQQSVREANAADDRSAAAVFEANIASLYSEMGELDAAAQWTQGTLARLNQQDRREHGAMILIQLATLRARQHRMDEARQRFAQGISEADARGNLELTAIGWNRLGEEYLKQNDLERAEGPLLEAYRIRELHGLALDSSYRSLGRLRLEQGDLEAASALLDRAVELAAGPQGAIPSWDIYHYRGRVRLAQGRLREALDDLRLAVRLAREWRWNVPPDDAARMGAEGWLAQVHSAFVEAGNRLYRQTGDPSLIRETFEAAEENRASSLRALVRAREADLRKSLPPEYWEALARLQRAEIQALRSPASGQNEPDEARAELTRIESGLGPFVEPPPVRLMESSRGKLDPDSVLLSFHLGRDTSWLWALDSEGLALYDLPGRAEIARLAGDATDAIRSGQRDSGRLFAALFGQLAPRFQRKTRWLVALESALFEVPMAALIDAGGRPLAEKHVVEIVPGGGYWIDAQSQPKTSAAPLFVGVGDPIYNSADPRLPRGARSAVRESLPLPRLVASAVEIDEAARSWNGERVLLKGADASRVKLLAQLARDPAVVHIATHVVESGEQPAYGLIALSLTPQRQNELVPPFEIARWRTRAGLVVLSGCRSGEGASLPGTGRLGLTRAWLTAGARAVIASNWATPDDTGTMFAALYRNLSGHPGMSPAAALRESQVEMIRSGGWRSSPRYWGSYFVMGAQ